jgi:hypothetical protein
MGSPKRTEQSITRLMALCPEVDGRFNADAIEIGLKPLLGAVAAQPVKTQQEIPTLFGLLHHGMRRIKSSASIKWTSIRLPPLILPSSISLLKRSIVRISRISAVLKLMSCTRLRISRERCGVLRQARGINFD